MSYLLLHAVFIAFNRWRAGDLYDVMGLRHDALLEGKLFR